MKTAMIIAASVTLVCIMLSQVINGGIAAKIRACEKGYSHAYCIVKVLG